MTAAASNVSQISEKAPPPDGKKPSVAAREAEAAAEDGYVTVEQCGIELRIPLRGKMTIPAMDAFRAGDNYGGTQELIGEEQWKLLHAARATMDDLDELGEKIRAAWGN